MKRLIVLLLLFAAIKVAGQSTGYFRYDTIRMYKQGGTCELYLINSTKDSLGLLTNIGGGLTRFIKPKVLNDSTIVVGLDTLVIRGGVSSSGSTISGLTAGRVTLSTSSTTIGDDANLLYNSTTNTLSTDTGRTIRHQSDTFYTYLPPKVLDTIVLFGNSYTTGSNATTTSRRYATLLCLRMGAIEKNLGVSGSTLMKRTPVDPYGAVNMIDRLSQIPTWTPLHRYIIFAYGFNDMGHNSANYTPANFRIDYQTVIDTCLARGWPRHRIVVTSVWFGGAAVYSAYAGTTGTPATDRARHNAFNDTTHSVATANGLRWVDVFTAQLNNDSTQLFSVDNIHPGDNGHQLIAQTIYTTLVDSVMKDGQTLAAQGKVELTAPYLKDVDSVGWEQPVLGIGTDNKIGMFNSHKIIKAMPRWKAQPGNINIVGSLWVGNVTAANAAEIETIHTPEGIKGRFLRANGTLPGGLADSAVEIGLLNSTTGYIGAYNRSGAGSGMNLSYNPLGALNYFGATSATGSNKWQFSGGNMHISTKLSIGQTATPTALLHLAAGTVTATTAPLKFTSGNLMGAAEVGAVEFLTDKYYATITTGTARKEITLNDIALTSGRIPVTASNGFLTDFSTLSYDNTNGIIRLGGTTSSFPGLQFNSTNLRARLADNSASTDLEVLDEAYSESTWNGSVEVPTKNAVRDQIESIKDKPYSVTYSMISSTSDATPTNMTSLTSAIDVPNNSVGIIKIHLVGNGGSGLATHKIQGVRYYTFNKNGGTLTIDAADIIIADKEGGSVTAASWQVIGASNQPVIEVTGVVAININWGAAVEIVYVIN